MERQPLTIEVCRRRGACLKLYHTEIEQIDEWVDARRGQGDSVTTFSNCEGICDRANNSSTLKVDGITGVKVTGQLPNGQKAEHAPAIAVSVNNSPKLRLIS